MKIVTRKGWGARHATGSPEFEAMASRRVFVVHHTAGPANQPIAEIQAYQIEEKKFLDIGYNFLIRGTTGVIYEGRGWSHVGAHVKGRNHGSLGVAIIGTDALSDKAKASLQWLYGEACRRAGRILTVVGHRDQAPTECPGDHIHRWIHSGALDSRDRPELRLTDPRTTGPDVRTVQEKIGVKVDGIYGPETERVVRVWQENHGLTVDGVVGPETWRSLG